MLVTLILGFILLSALAVCIVTYGTFWFHVAGTEHMDVLRRLSRGNMVRWGARAFATGLASQVASFALYPACLFKRFWLGNGAAPRDKDTQAKPPVLFVHGYVHTASAWVLFSNWFRKAGYEDLHAITYNSFSGRFPAIVDFLEQEIERILADRPGQQIVLVGHSLGGLVIRHFLNTSPLAKHVAAAVTLGSPHQGSTLANLTMSALGRALQYRGDIVKTIEEQETTPPAPCLSIYSPMDNMVVPHEGLRIRNEGWKEMEGRPVSHISMLYHRPTAEAALEFVESSLKKSPRPQASGTA